MPFPWDTRFVNCSHKAGTHSDPEESGPHKFILLFTTRCSDHASHTEETKNSYEIQYEILTERERLEDVSTWENIEMVPKVG
jgi:hypothetical protein